MRSTIRQFDPNSTQPTDPDNRYININIPNTYFVGENKTFPSWIPAVYDNTLTSPVIFNPSLDYISLINFTLVPNTIPLFIFALDVDQNNPNVGEYIIGIGATGIQYPENVVYAPANNLPVPVPGGSSPFFGYSDSINPYYFIYSVQQFINMINAALTAAVTASGIGVTAPFYIYDPITQLISLIVTPLFRNSGATIFMNAQLKNYLNSFAFTTQNDVNTGPFIYFHDLSTTPYNSPIGGPYQYMEEAVSIALWYDIRKIQVISALPIVTEASPLSVPQLQNLNGSSNNLPILSEFAVGYETLNDINEITIYNPTAQYRLIDMNPQVPITRINLSFQWCTKSGQNLPIYIAPMQTITAKMGFFNKDIYKKKMICNCG